MSKAKRWKIVGERNGLTVDLQLRTNKPDELVYSLKNDPSYDDIANIRAEFDGYSSVPWRSGSA